MEVFLADEVQAERSPFRLEQRRRGYLPIDPKVAQFNRRTSIQAVDPRPGRRMFQLSSRGNQSWQQRQRGSSGQPRLPTYRELMA